MKTRYYSLLVLLSVVSISIFLSCSNSTGPDDDHSFPSAIDSVATDITLFINSSSIWGYFELDTLAMDTEDTITISVGLHESYFIYARADGFYTELYFCSKGDVISIDLDGVPDVPNSVTGVIFNSQSQFSNNYASEIDISLTLTGGNSILSTTDLSGRYGFSNLTECDYILHSADLGYPKSFNITNSAGTDYKELFSLYDGYVIMAPNVYLYPESTIDINVDISFPNGGRVVESEPPYNNGWDVNVTPEGIIDGLYNYLFYDTKQPIALNYHSGWLLDGNDLENEIRHLLINLGYAGREIDDFVEFWLPKFGTTPYLAVYPQDVESMITLTINPVPDNLLRMIFFFRPLDESIELEELPLPDAIQRNGFTAIEWGGILANE